jgi:hypothetical protein
MHGFLRVHVQLQAETVNVVQHMDKCWAGPDQIDLT